MAHGFLNVFGAAAMAFAHDLEEKHVCEIITDTDASHFVFEGDSFAWQDLKVSAERIARARQHFAVSFGSCSFGEPVEDLRALGLL